MEENNSSNDTETVLLATLASRIYTAIAVQTVPHIKAGAIKAQAIEEACKESVQVASRILAHVKAGLAQEAANAVASTALAAPVPFGQRDQRDQRFAGGGPPAVRGTDGGLRSPQFNG